MRMEESTRPPLFTANSLTIVSKIVAFYAAFQIITVIFKVTADSTEANPLMPANAYAPLYFLAAVNAILLLVNGWSIAFKKHYWVIAISSIIIILISRFQYQQIAELVWQWTS